MSTKENNEVVIEKIDNEKESKFEFKGTKRSAEDKTEDVKKARKEENGADSDRDIFEEEEEEEVENCEEEEDDDDMPEGDDEELDGEEDEEDVEGEEEEDA